MTNIIIHLISMMGGWEWFGGWQWNGGWEWFGTAGWN